jgi:SPP1 family predicted phage head-tail adaptor
MNGGGQQGERMTYKPTGPEDLDKRITLQYSTKVSDGAGGFTTTWVDAASVFAAIWPTSASEVTAANSTTMVISHRIRIRFRSVLKASWRVKYKSRYFNIVSILNPNEAGEWLDIMCKEAAS